MIIFSLLSGCESVPETHESTELSVSSEQLDILETCRRNIGIASPDTLRAALNLLAESDVGKSEAGLEYAYFAARLMKIVYPVAMGSRSVPVAPVNSIYPGIFDAVESGRYPEIGQDDISYFTVLAAPVAVLNTADKTAEILSLDNIAQAVSMNDRAVLPLYLRGVINERNGLFDEALADYSAVIELDPSCYPAEMGTARIYLQTGRNEAAADLMDLLTAQYPFSIDMLSAAAETRFLIRDYSGAQAYSAEVLRLDPDNPEIQLLRAKIFLKQENYQQAGRLIGILGRMKFSAADFYYIKSEIEKADGDYLSALNTLEKGRAEFPDDPVLGEAYGAVLMLAGRRDEAREILTGESAPENTGADALIVLIGDAIESEDWEAAAEYAGRISDEDFSLKAGIAVWRVWYLQSDYEKALGAAERLYAAYPSEADAVISYVRTLVDMRRRLQAERLLTEKLPEINDPEKKSTLYYFKSLVAETEEEKLQALRSSLFENLQNVEALIEISRLYTEMGDLRKSYRYLKQAAALAPDDPAVADEMRTLEELLD